MMIKNKTNFTFLSLKGLWEILKQLKLRFRKDTGEEFNGNSKDVFGIFELDDIFHWDEMSLFDN